MKMIPILKIVFSLLLVWMCYKVIGTSLESNLFKEWDFLGNIPWMRATLWDFYANNQSFPSTHNPTTLISFWGDESTAVVLSTSPGVSGGGFSEFS